MDLNKVFLIGRLTADPVLRNTPSGQSVCNFGMATNRTWNDKSNQKQSEAEFHSIVLWGKLAEISAQFLKKGSMALIEGRLQTRSWEDSSGKKQYRTEVVGERMQMGPRNVGKFTPPEEQEKKEETEEIPVIEENYPPQSNSPSEEDNPDGNASLASKKDIEEEPEEIDVKDLPF